MRHNGGLARPRVRSGLGPNTVNLSGFVEQVSGDVLTVIVGLNLIFEHVAALHEDRVRRTRPPRLHFCNCSRETLQLSADSPDCTSATLHERYCNFRAAGAPEPKCSRITSTMPRPIGHGLAHDSVAHPSPT